MTDPTSSPAARRAVPRRPTPAPALALALASLAACKASQEADDDGSGCDPDVRTCRELAGPIRPTSGPAMDVAIGGDRAYLLSQGGLLVLDVSQPDAPDGPRAVSNANVGGFGLTLAGDAAYVAAGGQIVPVDLTTLPPTAGAPIVLGNRAIQRLAVAGDLAFATAGAGGVPFVDMARGEGGGFCYTLGTCYAWDVAARPGLLLVADGECGLRAYPDLSCEPGAAAIAPTTVETAGVAVAVFFRDADTAVIGSRPEPRAQDPRGALTTVDIADPLQPRRLAALPFAASVAFDLRGDQAYVVAEGCGGDTGEAALHVIDLADPAAPREVGCCPFPGRDPQRGGRGLAATGQAALFVTGEQLVMHGQPGFCPRAPAGEGEAESEAEAEGEEGEAEGEEGEAEGEEGEAEAEAEAEGERDAGGFLQPDGGR